MKNKMCISKKYVTIEKESGKETQSYEIFEVDYNSREMRSLKRFDKKPLSKRLRSN
jgi:hypothetical protein